MDDRARIVRRQSTLVAQALGLHEPATNGTVPAIHMATTFIRDSDNQYSLGHVYGRADNVSLQQAEKVIAALDGASEALLFVSGMSAAAAVVSALERPSHIVASEVMYWGLRRWFRGIGSLGHCVTFVDTSNLDAVRSVVRPGETRLFWIETPSNPLWTITDIEAVADIAHSVGADVCVDSTVSTPIFTQPLSHGADLVMHSATKYLNGHSDVVAGSLATLQDSLLWSRIRSSRNELGTALGSFESWLLLRVMRTLDVRVRAQARSAALLSQRLEAHPSVLKVLYPGLKSHVGHQIATRQMVGGFGGMLSVRIRGGQRAAVETAARVRLWKRATSLGGVESLIEHRSSIEGHGTPCPPDLLRLSVGLEDIDDLYADLNAALVQTN